MIAADQYDDLRRLIVDLREDIDDEFTWEVFADWMEEFGPERMHPRSRPDTVIRKVWYLYDALKLLAPTPDGKDRLEEMTFHSNGYAEPGYTDPQCGLIALGNWNAIGRYDDSQQKTVYLDDTPAVYGKMLNQLGVETEWHDEWTDCSECGKLVRTQPNGWDWRPTNEVGDGWLMCADCHQEDVMQAAEAEGEMEEIEEQEGE